MSFTILLCSKLCIFIWTAGLFVLLVVVGCCVVVCQNFLFYTPWQNSENTVNKNVIINYFPIMFSSGCAVWSGVGSSPVQQTPNYTSILYSS